MYNIRPVFVVFSVVFNRVMIISIVIYYLLFIIVCYLL